MFLLFFFLLDGARIPSVSKISFGLLPHRSYFRCFKIFRVPPAPPNSPRLSPQSISAPHAGGEYRPDSEKRYGQNYQSNPSCVRRMLQIRFTHTSPLYRHTRAISPPSPHFIFLLHRAIFPSSGRFTGPSTKRRSDEDPALLNFLNRSNSNVR